jgi:hypothetical protein
MQKVLDISNHLIDTPKDFQLVVPARRFIKEGLLTKANTKGKNQERYFFVFNDIIGKPKCDLSLIAVVYAKASSKKKYSFKGVIAVETMSIRDMPDDKGTRNLLEYNDIFSTPELLYNCTR